MFRPSALSLCILVLFSLLLVRCSENPTSPPPQVPPPDKMCSNGMIYRDSLLFMQNGGQAFGVTLINTMDTTHVEIPSGMVLIPGGTYSQGVVNPMGITNGGQDPFADARPIHRVTISPFLMDAHEVTNAQFEEFVKATGYITIAEQKPTHEEFPGIPDSLLVPGSLVFSAPTPGTEAHNYLDWWHWQKGADWRHPQGPGSTIEGKPDHPVVHIAWPDAQAYAAWAGKRLPTEAEWEFAARGGQAGQLYAWGNQWLPNGQYMANTFQGTFPVENTEADGYPGAASVAQYPANAFGLYDMAGNVWEWCADWYHAGYYLQLGTEQETQNPEGPSSSYDPQEPLAMKKVQRGGSFLCTDQYCSRYIIGSRGRGEWRTSSDHVGFRCVRDIPQGQEELNG